MGEALQWGKVCNGFSAPLQIFQGEGLQWVGGGGLQYNTGIGYYLLDVKLHVQNDTKT